MPLPKDKKKFALWAKDETFERIEKLYKEDGCKTKSEFIERSINFYCGYLTSENYREYFPSVVVSTLKGSLDGLENRMASLLFKLAVELSMMLHVTAANSEVDEETLSELRGLCVNEVKRLRGSVSFEEALKFQKG